MGLVVNTNVTSEMVQSNLTAANNAVNKSIERLSTGYKINSAADDPAGLSIAMGFESQANGTLVAKDNTQHGINLLQTADGDLDVIHDNLQRIRDLTLQAANGTYSTSEKMMLANEVNSRISEINRIAHISCFSEIHLLDGTYQNNLVLQVGANSDAGAATDAEKYNQLDIHDALTKATATALSANFVENIVKSKFSTSTGANEFLKDVDDAIKKVTDSRAKIGAYQNRLESTVNSLDTTHQNMSSSLSTIRDTDVASEAANLTKSQILQSVNSSLLTQANNNPAIVVNLI